MDRRGRPDPITSELALVGELNFCYSHVTPCEAVAICSPFVLSLCLVHQSVCSVCLPYHSKSYSSLSCIPFFFSSESIFGIKFHLGIIHAHDIMHACITPKKKAQFIRTADSLERGCSLVPHAPGAPWNPASVCHVTNGVLERILERDTAGTEPNAIML